MTKSFDHPPHNLRNFIPLLIINILVLSCTVPSSKDDQHTAITPTTSASAATVLISSTHTQTSPPATAAPTLITTTQTAPQVLGCREPSDNYEILTINGHQLNARTLEMLEVAQSIYAGEIEITGNAITQGSYTNAVEASFGTHAGGGAVDLSVMAPGTFTILVDDIQPLVKALRLAGFAAWYRDFDDLYEGSPVHIHTIAIGDRELSLAAREQLAGPHGYFWGYDGLPVDGKLPNRDPHGGPIVCDWMMVKGYPNKTATPSPQEE